MEAGKPVKSHWYHQARHDGSPRIRRRSGKFKNKLYLKDISIKEDLVIGLWRPTENRVKDVFIMF